MDDATKSGLINRLGVLQFANIELGAQNSKLQQMVLQQAQRIRDLEATQAPTADLPANPYEKGEANAKPH